MNFGKDKERGKVLLPKYPRLSDLDPKFGRLPGTSIRSADSPPSSPSFPKDPKVFLVEGALLECSSGSKGCFLMLPNSNGVYTLTAPQIIRTDCEVPQNIEGFGICEVTGEECVPKFHLWENPKTEVKLNGEPPVSMASKLICTKHWKEVTPVLSGQGHIDLLGDIKKDNKMAMLLLLARYDASILKGRQLGTKYGGDPINTTTGNFICEKKDLSIPGAISLDFTRFYNAQGDVKGVLGYGWTHSYNIMLISHDDAVTIDFEDGRREVYAKTGKDIFTPLLDYRKELKKTRGGYTLTTHNNDIYTFDDDGHLVSKTDLNNNSITLSYTGGLLECVESEIGIFKLAYSNDGLLAKVEDHAGRCVEYTYDNGLLVYVARPLGDDYEYQYNKNRKLNYIENSIGNFMRNEYDKDGRVIEQSFADGGVLSNQYDEDEHCATMTERNGSATNYYRDDSYRTVKIGYDDGSEELFEYNNQNLRTSHRDRNGNTTEYEYDSNGNVTRTIDPMGNVTETFYNHLNKPTSIKRADGSYTLYSYDEKGNLLSTTGPLGQKYECNRNEKGAVKQLVLPDGSATTLRYDRKGNIIEVDRHNQSTLKYEYNEINRVVASIDGKGNRTEYAYNDRGDITRVVNALELERRYEYNSVGKVIKITDFDGSILLREYNQLGKPSKYIDQEGNETTLEYDLMWNVSKQIDAAGNTTIYQYNRLNRLEKVINAKGNETKYEYDPNGNKTMIIVARGENTTLLYDALNRISEVTEPDGAITSIEYDAMGRVINVINPLGFEHKITYDLAGQKIREVDPTNRELTYSYTPLGLISEITDSANRKTKYEYLPGGLLKKVTYPNGTSRTYEYDANMNIVSQTSQDGLTVHYEYDCLNQLTKIYTDKGSEYMYFYDAVGNITSTKDGNGNVIQYVYSPAGRLISMIDPLGSHTDYNYDEVGNLTEIKQFAELDKVRKINERNSQLHITKYTYDALGRVEKTIDALGNAEEYTYDEAGNPLTKLDKDGYLTKYSFDIANQLEEIQYADGKSVKFSYNPLRQLTEIEDWLGLTTIEVDEAGRAKKVTDYNGRTVEYGYGSEGEPTSIQYPDGKLVEYKYDEALRLKALIDGNNRVDYIYDINSRLCEKMFSNGAHTKYLYNDLGLLNELAHSDNEGILDKFVYTYDNIANKTVTEKFRRGLREESGSYQYTYDALSRLTEVRKDGRAIKIYGYDAFGNRSFMVDKGMRTEYTYNPLNQLIHLQGSGQAQDFSYDARGNLIQVLENGKIRNTYEFSPLNRLSKATNAAGQVASYEYNALGFRVGKQLMEGLSPLQKIDYVLDLTKRYHNLLQTEDGAGAQDYVWDIMSIVASADNTSEHFYIHDELGSPLRYIDNVGNVIDSYGYDEFGNSLYSIEAHQPFGFTGYQYDDVARTYFAQAREYDPLTARMISSDIHWNPWNMIFGDFRVQMKHGALVPDISSILQGNNLYVYCISNPLVQVDYTGFVTYGIGFNASAAFLLRIGVTGQIVFDDKGNVGVLISGAAGGGTPNATASAVGTITNASDIYKLTGMGMEAGVSFPIGGIEAIGGRDDKTGENWVGVNLSAGVSVLPAEGHGEITYGWLIKLTGEDAEKARKYINTNINDILDQFSPEARQQIADYLDLPDLSLAECL